MSKVESIEVYVRPTVDLESAAAYVALLNLFLKDNERYAIIQHGDGKLEIVEVVRT